MASLSCNDGVTRDLVGALDAIDTECRLANDTWADRHGDTWHLFDNQGRTARRAPSATAPKGSCQRFQDETERVRSRVSARRTLTHRC
jgi:hypothetical protein